MLKILATSDFSDASKHALRYAIKITENIQGEIVLLNVVYMDGPPAASMSSMLLESMKTKAYFKFQEFAESLDAEFGRKLNLQLRVEIGYPVARIIEKVAAEENAELIVLGRKGLSGLEKVFIGSVAAHVAMNSKYPVLLVPAKAELKPVEKMVDACDLYQTEEEFETVTYFASKLNATITMLHIFSDEEQRNKNNFTELATTMQEKFHTNNFNYASEVNSNVVDGIEHYLQNNATDMLVVFTHKRLFYERLFNRSVSKELANEIDIPVLVLKAN